MNKVINISINGVVFTIDEHAYTRLHQYIESLKKHFEGTAGADEIIADIEARIAELIEQRLAPNQRVVTEQITDEVIALMGMPFDIDHPAHEQNEKSQSQTESNDENGPRKLRRDKQNAVVGGVCAGLADYFNVDPVLVRIVFLVLFFTLGSGGFIYILLWFAIPEDKDSANRTSGRKLFRDEANAVIGGVCSGVGAYLGIDAVWLRIGFLISFFVFGTGLLLYILLWIIIPKAKTASDKLQMQGKPVDVSNIEQKVRETIKEGEENISKTMRTNASTWKIKAREARPVLNNIVVLLLRIIGFFILFFGLALLVALSAIYLFKQNEWNTLMQYAQRLVPDASVLDWLILGIVLMLSSIIIGLLSAGIRLLFQFRYKIKWIALLTSVIGTSGFIIVLYATIRYASAMDESAVDKVELLEVNATDTIFLSALHLYPLAADSAEKRITVTLNDDIILNESYFAENGLVLANALLSVKTSANNNMKLIALKIARGSSTIQALKTAQNIETQVQHTGKILNLNNRIFISDNDFAFQQLEYELNLPVGTVIKTDKYVTAMLNRAYMDEDFGNGSVFLVTSKGLVCVDATENDNNREEDDEEDEDELEINIRINENEAGGNDRNHIRIRVSDEDLRLHREKRMYMDKEKCKTEVKTKAGNIEITETR
jgi:phage shock protein PspC (stress-responsive transcriptional regulator)